MIFEQNFLNILQQINFEIKIRNYSIKCAIKEKPYFNVKFYVECNVSQHRSVTGNLYAYNVILLNIYFFFYKQRRDCTDFVV